MSEPIRELRLGDLWVAPFDNTRTSDATADTLIQTLIEALPAPVYLKDRAHRWRYVNRAFADYMGVDRKSLVGQSESDYLGASRSKDIWDNDELVFATGQPLNVREPDPRSGPSRSGHLHAVQKSLVRPNAETELIFALLTSDKVSPLPPAESAPRVIPIDSDASGAPVLEVFSDPLTKLPNRRSFLNTLESTLAHNENSTAVMVVNIDHFNLINDRFAHVGGDAVIRQVATRLRRAIRPEDILGRLDGDDFVVAAQNIDIAEAEALADDILLEIAHPFSLLNQDLRLSVSIGIAICPLHGDTSETLVRHARMALNWCKRRSRGQYQVYSDGSSSAADRLASIELKLPLMLENGELETRYQPIVTSRDGMVVGFEALVRWTDRELGELGPAEFIPIAEEMGLIHKLGRRIIDRACAFLGSLSDPEMLVSVNVSGSQLTDETFPIFVAETLQKHNAFGERLFLEITESAAMESEPAVWQVLEELSATGVRLVIDDFGTGFSNLARLKQLPFAILKIDREFVRDLPESPQDSAIFRAIHAIAKELNLKVVAEGIETAAQEDIARRLGVDYLQGYRFGHPMPLDKLRRYTV